MPAFNLTPSGPVSSGSSSSSSGTLSLPDVAVASQSLSLTSATNAVTVALAAGTATINLTLTFGASASGVVIFERSSDGGTTWVATNAMQAGASGSTMSASGLALLRGDGSTHVRVRSTTAGSGTVTVAGNQSRAVSSVNLGSPAATRTPVTLTATVVTLTAGTAARLIGVNATRKSIQILNIGTGFATVQPSVASSVSAVVSGSGYPLEPAGAQGHQGGSTPIYDGVNTSTDAWDAISMSGTTILVLEGN